MVRPRLLLVTVDRLPAWILPAWGSTWVSAPGFDRLAAEGLVLDRVTATSLDPGLTLDGIAGGLVADARAAGLAPLLVTDDPTLRPPADGETVVVPVTVPARRARDAGRTVLGRLFAATLSAIGTGHRLVWVHATSLGRVWDAPEDFDAPYVDEDDPTPPAGVAPPALAVDGDTDPDLVVGWRQRFAGQVSLLDRLVAALVEGLPDGEEPWGVCLAGIRGLPLGLHGSLGVPPSADEEPPFAESIHLPVILVDPWRRMAGQRYPGLVIPADVGATIRDLLRLDPAPPASPAPGRSLAGLLAEWRHAPRDRVVCVAAGGVAVVTRSWRWVSPTVAEGACGAGRLHAEPDDFFERCDVADRCADVAAGLGRIGAVARGGAVDLAWTMPLEESESGAGQGGTPAG